MKAPSHFPQKAEPSFPWTKFLPLPLLKTRSHVEKDLISIQAKSKSCFLLGYLYFRVCKSLTSRVEFQVWIGWKRNLGSRSSRTLKAYKPAYLTTRQILFIAELYSQLVTYVALKRYLVAHTIKEERWRSPGVDFIHQDLTAVRTQNIPSIRKIK